MKLNKATLKSALRGFLGVLAGIALYLAKEPKYAPLAALLPFVLRYVDPTEKEIGIGQDIASTLDKSKTA